MTLRSSLLAAIVTAIAAMVLTLVLVEDPLVEHRQTARARDELRDAADETALAIRNGEDPDRAADRVGAATGAWITVVDRDGRVIGDTALDDDDLGALRESTLSNGPAHEGVLYASLRGPDETVVHAARSTASIDGARASTRELLVLGGLLAGLSVLLLTWVLSRTLVRPIEELTRTADAIARGDLSIRIRTDRKDELGRLGRALDRMADELSARLREVRAEEGRLVTVLDSMAEAVFVTDPTGMIVVTNQHLDALVGQSAQGKSVVEAIESSELHEAVWAAMRGEATSVELELGEGDDLSSIAAHVAPLPEQRGVVAVLHDVTELKRADKIRRDFVANASHELRTPLTAIRGFAETLRDGAATDPEVAQRFLDTILRHTTRLQRVVDDLLALSRAEAADQEFELGPTDIAIVVRDAARHLEAHAQQKQIDVRLEGFDDLPLAHANEVAVDHVMVNLLDNAVKYTPTGGRVTVRAAQTAEHVVVIVSDTGPGIPRSKQDRIFERFFRIDKGRARDQGGTGLGLSIVKHLVQRMNGAIEVESRPGEGATFRLTLARAQAQPTSISSSGDVPADETLSSSTERA